MDKNKSSDSDFEIIRKKAFELRKLHIAFCNSVDFNSYTEKRMALSHADLDLLLTAGEWLKKKLIGSDIDYYDPEMSMTHARHVD